jgi:hypothetical protein
MQSVGIGAQLDEDDPAFRYAAARITDLLFRQ